MTMLQQEVLHSILLHKGSKTQIAMGFLFEECSLKRKMGKLGFNALIQL